MVSTYICPCRSFDKTSPKKKKTSSQPKKKATIPVKKVAKTVLVPETPSPAPESPVAAVGSSDPVMSDALKRPGSPLVGPSKRQALPPLVASSPPSFHRDETSSQIASLSLELIRTNRDLAQFKEEMHSEVPDLAKKVAKVAANATQLSAAFDDLRRAMGVLKDRLLAVKKLIRGGRVVAPSPEIGSGRGAFAPLAEAAGGRVPTVESDHEDQEGKFFNRPREINRIG